MTTKTWPRSNSKVLDVIVQKLDLNKCNNIDKMTCVDYHFGKLPQNRFLVSDSKTFSPLELLHTNVRGVALIATDEGYKYYIFC